MVDVLVGGKKREDVLLERLHAIKNGPTDPENAPPELPFPKQFTRFGKLLFETIKPKSWDDPTPWPYQYDVGLRNLQLKGYHRIPRPAELFHVINEYLDKRSSRSSFEKAIEPLFNDITQTGSEWASLAIKWTPDDRNKVLTIYLDPLVPSETPRSGPTTYDFSKLEQCTFDAFRIPTKLSAGVLRAQDIAEIDDGLVKVLFGRSFDDLPKEIQQNGSIYLPYSPSPMLLTIGDLNNPYQFNPQREGTSGARGVRILDKEEVKNL